MKNAQPAHVGDDTCLDLVMGLLAADARRTALDHARTCPACEQRLQETAASHARAEAATVSVLSPSRAITATRTPAAVRRIATVAALTAATVAVAIGVTRFVRHEPAPLPHAADAAGLYRLPDAHPRSAIRNFGASPADSLVLAGLAAYGRRDLAAARRMLALGGSIGRMDDVRRIYLGATLLELGDAAAALATLRGLGTRFVPEPWKSETRWSLAMALAGTGAVSAADSLLAILASESGPVADRARTHRARTSQMP